MDILVIYWVELLYFSDIQPECCFFVIPSLLIISSLLIIPHVVVPYLCDVQPSLFSLTGMMVRIHGDAYIELLNSIRNHGLGLGNST